MFLALHAVVARDLVRNHSLVSVSCLECESVCMVLRDARRAVVVARPGVGRAARQHESWVITEPAGGSVDFEYNSIIFVFVLLRKRCGRDAVQCLFVVSRSPLVFGSRCHDTVSFARFLHRPHMIVLRCDCSNCNIVTASPSTPSSASASQTHSRDTSPSHPSPPSLGIRRCAC